MKVKLIKKLAEMSFSGNEIDEEKVNVITAKLKKKDIRTYVKALKLLEQRNTVEVETSTAVDASTEKRLHVRFPEKKIVYTLNKELLAGMKIRDNDILYDFSVQGKIDRVIKHLYDVND